MHHLEPSLANVPVKLMVASVCVMWITQTHESVLFCVTISAAGDSKSLLRGDVIAIYSQVCSVKSANTRGRCPVSCGLETVNSVGCWVESKTLSYGWNAARFKHTTAMCSILAMTMQTGVCSPLLLMLLTVPQRLFFVIACVTLEQCFSNNIENNSCDFCMPT